MDEVEYKTILYHKDKEVPHIVYITLNRPEKSNAISIGPDEMTGEIQDAMKRVNDDDEVKVAIFRAKGENFSAGFDLAMVYRVYGGEPGVRPSQRIRLHVDEDQLMGFARTISDCNKVTMAQVHGWCIEAGMFIVESSDIAIAAKNAQFAHRGQRLAFGGMLNAAQLITQRAKKLREIAITGRTISGEEAEEIGIITKAVPPEEVETETYNLAKAICVLPRDAIYMGKLATREAYESLGATRLIPGVIFHTLATSIKYEPQERDLMFIREREEKGARPAFHKFHSLFEEALDKTKYFKSYRPE